MNRISVLFLLLLTSCFSNEQKNPAKPEFLKRDTILRSYVDYYDSLFQNKIPNNPFGPNSDIYRVLKAYSNNDTNYLKTAIGNLSDNFCKYGLINSVYVPIVPDLKNFRVEKGFQFHYYESFCDDNYVFTITRIKDFIKLNTLIFRQKENIDFSKSRCKIIKNFDTLLSNEDWDIFVKSLDEADFWTMNPTSLSTESDSLHMKIVGVENCLKEKSIQKSETFIVYRTNFKNKAIYNSLLGILSLSKIKRACSTESYW
jgi:hypothetical protein